MLDDFGSFVRQEPTEEAVSDGLVVPIWLAVLALVPLRVFATGRSNDANAYGVFVPFQFAALLFYNIPLSCCF